MRMADKSDQTSKGCGNGWDEIFYYLRNDLCHFRGQKELKTTLRPIQPYTTIHPENHVRKYWK